MPQSVPIYLLDRLRSDAVPASVPGSLPVLFFGDPSTSLIATIGINPSKQEYLSPTGRELDGHMRRFETLASLRAASRITLDETQAYVAVRRMRRYFDSNFTVYGWFSNLSRVVEGMGMSFRERSATHLDLVQEATDPTWSLLFRSDPVQARALLRRDLPFLQKQIERSDFRASVCTSAIVCKQVSQMLGVQFKRNGRVARLNWSVGTVELSRGLIGVAGWNIPLKRPTGLNLEGEYDLGKLLADQLQEVGIRLQ